MTDLEEAMLRLREAIDILEHPDYLGCSMEAGERIEDALAKLKNVDEPMTERFQLQIDKYNEMITLLQEMKAMIDAPGVCPHSHGQTVGPCIGKGCRDWDDTKGCIWEPPAEKERSHWIDCKKCGQHYLVKISEIECPNCGASTEEK